MIDLIGVNPIFSSSIRLVIAQRLVRRLSGNKKERPATEAEAKFIRRVLDGLPEEELRDYDLDNIMLYDPVATEEEPFGYSGRMVLMEQMVVDDDIAKYLRGDIEDIDAKAIEKTARAHGMLTLEQKGVMAVLRGETTLEEIARVI
jgi:type II secretory ATPase GspE/PulE/Tfp pilus assembly ATPase PilB-like protein